MELETKAIVTRKKQTQLDCLSTSLSDMKQLRGVPAWKLSESNPFTTKLYIEEENQTADTSTNARSLL